MTTITKERIELFVKSPLENGLTRGEQMELALIALASLEEKPVAWECGENIILFNPDTVEAYAKRVEISPKPLYSAPPAPVVPEGIPKGLAGQIVSLLAHNIGDKFLAQKIWNACRAAMLQGGGEPVSQTYKLPELIEGMEVSIDVSTCDADAGNRYFGTVTEVSELYTAKNGYILLVQDAEPNFDVNGNSPVQSPIDHGYRPECECSGCKATARICAELNNEEAEIFADGYNAAMQSFGNSEQLNSPVTPDGYALVPVEPTRQMMAQGHFAMKGTDRGKFRRIYQAMITAAPALNKGGINAE